MNKKLSITCFLLLIMFLSGCDSNVNKSIDQSQNNLQQKALEQKDNKIENETNNNHPSNNSGYKPEITYNYDPEKLEEILKEMQQHFGGKYGHTFYVLDVIKQGPKAIPRLKKLFNELTLKKDLTRGEETTIDSLIFILTAWKEDIIIDYYEKEIVNPETTISLVLLKKISPIGSDKTFKLLEKSLKHSNDKSDKNFSEKMFAQEKMFAIGGLGYCGDSRGIPLLQKELMNTNNSMEIRVGTAAMLGWLGNTDGLSIAMEGVKSEDSDVKNTAIYALGVIGDISAKNKLEELLLNNNNSNDIKLAIRRIEANQLNGDEKINYIKETYKNFKQEGAVSNFEIAELKKIGTEKSINALKELSESNEYNIEAIVSYMTLR